jgi:hypothetical protein
VNFLQLLAAFVLGSGGTEFIRWWSGRGRNDALRRKIEVEASDIVAETHRELIQDLRKLTAQALQEAADARLMARDAQLRAAEAEARAAAAEARAQRAELAMGEMNRLVREQVPDADELIRNFEKLTAQAARRAA